MRFEILKAKDGQYYFNIVSNNNEIVATSELYTTKQSAIKTTNSIFNGLREYEISVGQEGTQQLNKIFIDKT